jgi:thiol-disulfide isomerase/thioredoxin
MAIAVVLLGSSCRPWARENRSDAGSGDPQATPTRKVARVGAAAPGFELEDLQGNKVRLSDWSGQVVLINFWATWCGYCRQEFPLLQTFYGRYKNDGFVVLTVNIQETQEQVQRFIDETGLDLPVLLDQAGTVGASYRVRGLPTSFLVGRDGVVLDRHIGPVSETILDGYLAQSGVQ